MGLGALDLNLLLPLNALLEYQNVSRAAEHLTMSQPATSQALARLRRHFDDELLVRVGREYQLTPLAQVLRPQVAAALHQVTATLDIRARFDARSSDRTFVVSASDYARALLAAPVRRLLLAEAPCVSICFAAMPVDYQFENHLLAHDLVIGPLGHSLPGHTDLLWRDDFVAVLDPGNPAAVDGRLSLEALAGLPHAVGVFGENIQTPADRLIDELGVRRRVVVTVPGFLSLAFMVQGTDVVALVPRRLASHPAIARSVAIAEIPDSHRTTMTEAIHCRTSRREDPALQWLRGALVRAARTLDDVESALLTL